MKRAVLILAMLASAACTDPTGQARDLMASANELGAESAPDVVMKQLTALAERADSVTDKALKKGLLDAYGDGVARLIIKPVLVAIEADLRKVPSVDYAADFDNLKAYLLLLTPAKIPEYRDWLVATMGKRYKQLRPQAKVEDAVLSHTSRYLRLLETKRFKPLQREAYVAYMVRHFLVSPATEASFYDHVVHPLDGQATVPPFVVASSMLETTAKVRGSYTAKGHVQVTKSLAQAKSLLARDEWLFGDGKLAMAHEVRLARVSTDYTARFATEWATLMGGVRFRAGAEGDRAAAVKALLDRASKASAPVVSRPQLLEALAEPVRMAAAP